MPACLLRPHDADKVHESKNWPEKPQIPRLTPPKDAVLPLNRKREEASSQKKNMSTGSRITYASTVANQDTRPWNAMPNRTLALVPPSANWNRSKKTTD